jgi:two-component system OmpR family sensor kinase
VSIRLRVVLTTVLITAIALGAADLASFQLLRRYVNGRAASGVRQVAQTAAAATGSGRPITLDLFSQTDRPVLVELRAPDGRILQRVGAATDEDLVPNGLTSTPGRAVGVEVEDGPPRYEAMAVPDARGRTVVAVISLSAEVATLRHLIVLNLWVGAIVLIALAVVATILLTRSLRPLRRIATTADAIAAGRLAERVPAAPANSEIGRVSTAINRMLEEIESAFGERDATERRLRQFLADASHELRTPLTSIRGYAELFRRGADRRPEDLAHAMAAIESEGERMSRLVEDLLLLARLDSTQSLAREPVDLGHVVEEAVAAARVVDDRHHFGFELGDRPLVVAGDGDRLRQVVDNLLANVRRHTPPGSSAYVSVRRSGSRIVVAVEDDGPGIPPAERERVFDRFFRPDDGRQRVTGGAGLGLSIVRSIVAAHGGSIAIREARPHGALFEIDLPAAGSQTTPRPGPARTKVGVVPSTAETDVSARSETA